MKTGLRSILPIALLFGAVPLAAQVDAGTEEVQVVSAETAAPLTQVPGAAEVAPQAPASVVGEATPGQSSVAPAAEPTGSVAAGQDSSEVDSVVEEPSPEQLRWDAMNRSRSVVLFGSDAHVHPADTVREVVVIGGSALIEGHVLNNVVVVGGDVDLGPGASVSRDLVNVLGTTTIPSGASIGRELVVVGGRLDAPEQFRAGRSQNVIALPGGLQAFASGVFPWVTDGLLWGRVVVPGLPWMWGIVGIAAFTYLLIGFLFHGAVTRAAKPLEERPLSTFLVGLLALVLVGPIVFVLAVSVVGIVVIPFFLAALAVASLLGRVAVAGYLGGQVMRVTDEGDRIQSVRSLGIGMVILLVAYMIPLLGLIIWMFAGVFGLGGATVAALASLRRENPVKEKPKAPPVPPAPGGGEGGGTPYSGTSGASSFSRTEAHPPAPGFGAHSAPEWRAPEGAEPPPGASGYAGFAGPATGAPPTPAASGLLSFPYATFWERLGAFAIDILLVAVTFVILPVHAANEFSIYLFLLLVYSIGFWAWKGATIGGTILQLRVVQASGRLPSFGEAIVRGFSGILSLGALGVGGLWILWDPERQGWHDRIAGSYVVKVPRDYPY